MNQRLNFLALILIDALDDENEEDICSILDKNMVDPSFVPIERGIAPLHFSCGMENAELSYKITKRFLESGANPNVLTDENMTPLHIAAMHGRVGIVEMLLEHNAQLDISDDQRKTPLHYAIEECYFEVVQVMRDHIFQNKFREKQKHHSKILKCKQNVSQDSLSKSKFEYYLQKKICNQKTSTPNAEPDCKNTPDKANNKALRVTNEMLDSIKYTPNRVHYNYDVTSPYYINITHRRHQLQPKFPVLDLPPKESADIGKNTETSEKMNLVNKTFVLDESSQAEEKPINLFALTRENVEELSQTAPDHSRSRVSLIDVWRQKVQNTKARQTILKEYDDISEMIDNVMASDHLNFTNVLYKEKSSKTTDGDSGACGSIASHDLKEGSEERVPQRKVQNVSLGALIQRVAEAQTAKLNVLPDTESSYQTVPEFDANRQNNLEVPDAMCADLSGMNSSMSFIRSPKSDFYLQMKEAYVHTDDENGLVFYETKLPSNPGNKVAQQRSSAIRKRCNLNQTTTTQSTNITLPIDYETDELRAELTTFGEAPGPITKTTKRLYIKRLVKYKRNPELMKELREKQSSQDQKFSVELYRTVRREEEFENIANYLKYEADAMSYFANNKEKRNMREGHLKQSFIYMLIDPCISCNLPGESVYLNKPDVWKRFLHSIFYVGKGKSSRPYSHLYDAMKAHSQLHSGRGTSNEKKVPVRKHTLNMDLIKSPPTKFANNKKLDRILKIWGNGCGVVCLNVFHNILPIEAYTREAAIIDALSLNHLTNIKRGDYYGPSKNWSMKIKKQLGIALLYKSLQIYLAEGESQLAPSDLI
ncbi:uncharacterized protein LOC119669333 [Teleopsis dalmanni]|uniref:uncharacterized protein LOC119669333 n=1 Tax=Teleopsis dalmanni TaxID=139649 RepID=UPI0018CF67FF|nr:uncharacterized protein LOC119669333 [Teleopsis dalmanni]